MPLCMLALWRLSVAWTTRVSFYHVIWLAKEKTKAATSRKSFCRSGTQTLFFGGENLDSRKYVCVRRLIKTQRCFNLNILSKPSKQIPKGRYYLKMSAIPSSCSLHEKLQIHCGSSRDKESFVLLSESNSNISTHLASCHLPKCGDITEAEQMLGKERAFASLTICLTHGHLFGKIWRAAKSCQYTCWEDCKCVGETSHYWSGRWMEWFFCLAKSPLLVRVSTIGLSFRLWWIFLRRPFPLRFIFGFYFHNVYLVSQRIISKENRISEKQVISRYQES